MIKFDIKTYHAPTQALLVEPTMIEFEINFRIEINGKLFFENSYFPLIEFLYFAEKWLASNPQENSMLYYSVETEENPLICFARMQNGYHIFSPWQLFDCADIFEFHELEREVKKLRSDLMKMVIQ